MRANADARRRCGFGHERLESRRLLSSVPAAAPNPGTVISDPDEFVTIGDSAYFFAAGPAGTRSLWKTNGLPGGTVLLKDGFVVSPGNPDRPKNATAVGGRLYFSASFGGAGEELWTSDGTPAGTFMLKDVYAGPEWSKPDDFTLFNGRVYFSARGPTGFGEVWSTDGTTDGTALVVDVTPGGDTGADEFCVSGGFLYFRSYVGTWRTDGTAAGTVKFRERSVEMLDVNGTLFFVEGSAGTPPVQLVAELWKTDGTPAGAAKLRTFHVNHNSAFRRPGGMANIGGMLFFSAVDDQSGPGADPVLWRSDGTAAGTIRLVDREPRYPGEVTEFNGRAVFAGYQEATGQEIWASDGTPEGTVLIAETAPGRFGGVRSKFYRSGGRLFFAAGTPDVGTEIFVSDGTTAGTALVSDLFPGSSSGVFVDEFTPLKATVVGNGRFIFAGRSSTGDNGAWSTDGTAAGTYRLAGSVASVVARHVFYNRSAFDGNDGVANAADDGAIAAGKAALLPGQSASFANVTGYSRGINGLMIDVGGGLPMTALAGIAAGVELKAGTGGDPATWADAPRPVQIGIRPGAGLHGSDRITLVWADGVIRNTWLRVTVRAVPQSGLSADDAFTYGNLVGETGDAGGSLAVSVADVLATRGATRGGGASGERYDHNRDGAVNVLDYVVSLRNAGRSLGQVSQAGAVVLSGATGALRVPSVRSALLARDGAGGLTA